MELKSKKLLRFFPWEGGGADATKHSNTMSILVYLAYMYRHTIYRSTQNI